MAESSVGFSSRGSWGRRADAAPPWRPSRPRLELVGRRDELAQLEDELGRAALAELRVVLLLGEAGVGKSRLGRQQLASRAGPLIGLALGREICGVGEIWRNLGLARCAVG